MSAVKFLGASVSALNMNMGWNESPSVLNVTLVEDLDAGDAFTRPAVGSPVTFTIDETGWYFAGIIQSSQERRDTNGNPLFEITVIDPRELLDGTYIILNGYTGTINTPNTYNVYGYLLTQGIYRSSAGFKLNQIISAMNTLLIGNTGYGSQLNLLGNPYMLNLAFPNVPDYYRITDDYISIMELVRRVCEDTNHDFFFSVVPGGFPTLTLRLRDRNAIYETGAINRFIQSVQGASVKYSGFEFASSTTSKFLTGGRIAKLFFQFPPEKAMENPYDEPIWPYWGVDSNRNIIIGEGENDEHEFTIEIDHWNIPELGSRYTTDVGELRAALDSQDAWESYLLLRDNNEYRINPKGENTANFKEGVKPFHNLIRGRIHGDRLSNGVFVEGSKEFTDMGFDPETDVVYLTYKHDGKKNPHFGKATKIGFNTSLLMKYVAAFLYSQVNMRPEVPIGVNEIKGFNPKPPNVDNSAAQILHEFIEHRRQQVYSFVRGYAEEYYGKQYMIKLPFVISNRDEFLQVFTSYETTDAAYLTEEDFAIAWQHNLLPIPFSNGFLYRDPVLSSEDGRIYAYARFDGQESCDFSDIPPDAIVVSPIFNSVFIRCEVEPQLVYQDYSLLYGPRAVVRLPGRVVVETDPFATGFNVVANFLYPVWQEAGKDNKVFNPSYLVESLVKDQAGADALNMWMGRYAVEPNLLGVPLLSQDRYGPWYAIGIQGRTEYEQDDELVPWNFNSYDEMNLVANSKVTQSISNNQFSENGTIEFPGFPSVLLGDALVAGGPAVTNISINVSQNLTTTYQMNSWPYSPYRLTKHRNDFIAKLGQRQKELTKGIREKVAQSHLTKSRNLALQKTIADIKKRAAKGNHSSHGVIIGEKINDKYAVYLQPTYNTSEQIETKDNKAILTLDNLLVPYCLNGGTNLPSLETGALENGIPNAKTLNPLQEGISSTYLLNNDEIIETESANFDWDTVRGIALKGPIVVTGWSYDLAGLPVQNSGLTLSQIDQITSGVILQLQEQYGEDIPEEILEEEVDNAIAEAQSKARRTFHQDYLTNGWKTGPIDLRWDEDRNVYTMGGYSFLARVIETSGKGPSMVKCRRYKIRYNEDPETGDSVNLSSTDFTFYAANFRENEVVNGTFYLVHNIDGVYTLDTQHTFLDFE